MASPISPPSSRLRLAFGEVGSLGGSAALIGSATTDWPGADCSHENFFGEAGEHRAGGVRGSGDELRVAACGRDAHDLGRLGHDRGQRQRVALRKPELLAQRSEDLLETATPLRRC